MTNSSRSLVLRGATSIPLVMLLILGNVGTTVQAKPPRTDSSDETLVIGKSVRGIPIVAKRYGAVGGKVVVAVGSIHGNEKIGLSITAALAAGGEHDGFELWIIDSANPDGTKLNQRWNANRVDLNRNFDINWKKIPCTYKAKNCSGTKAESEPETVALEKFMLKIQPQMVIFYHSIGYTIDGSGGGVSRSEVLSTYSKYTGIPIGVVPCGLTGCSGTATQYIHENIPAATPFIIELPCDTPCLTTVEIQRHLKAFWAAADKA